MDKKKFRILVADDDRALNQSLQDSLVERGYDVISTYDGPQTIKLVKKENPDLIILDVILPKLDGFTVCQQLKSDPLTRSIPIIMFTVQGQQTNRLQGLKLGAEDYVAKPFLLDSLVNKIEYLLLSRKGK